MSNLVLCIEFIMFPDGFILDLSLLASDWLISNEIGWDLAQLNKFYFKDIAQF